MSKQIDLSKPLSEEDRAYLLSRGRTYDIAIADGNDASSLSAGPSFDANTDAAKLLAETPNTGDVNTLGREAGAPDQSSGDAPTGEPSQYEDLTVAQLKDELERRDLPTTGKKPELVARLDADDAEQASSDDDDEDDGE